MVDGAQRGVISLAHEYFYDIEETSRIDRKSWNLKKKIFKVKKYISLV